MNSHLIIFLLLLITAITFSLVKKKLTPAGTIAATIIAIIINEAFGLLGVMLLATFFITGITATAWNRGLSKNISAKESQQRDAWQVLANGGIATLLAVLALMDSSYEKILLLMLAASFSSATADTISSELGNIYGSRFYNIIHFKKDTRGENGVVSVEGTIAGIIGSILIAMVYAIAMGFNWHSCIIIVIAGTIGNIADSVLGATLERKNIIGNNTVNFFNTIIAAVTAGAIY